MQPTSPQAALRLQNVVVALLVIVLLLEVVILVMTFLLGRHVNWWHFPVVPVGLLSLVVLTPAVVWLTVVARRNLAAHIVSADEHWCQCRECGRTVAPLEAPASPPARPAMTPQEKIRTASTLLVTLPVLLAVSLVALGYSLFGQGSDPVFPVLTVVNVGLLALLAIGSAVLIAVMLRRRTAAREELGRLGLDHGCTCRWCGTVGTPVQAAQAHAQGDVG
ncbi:hypothetical protein NF556_00635 [Ornithinimicrobium faecis]|uniref:Integral membrane protein n=1 Tax=Ornithinimicrobium faecis TaxID=2934158 RepID=A0ABY4YVM0_9MICO|nr:hypothetical protein [Ornithinimicrobium sp. HY1793]USQ80202.1 hypothetical protein NF556_00635 [Ornithinimicrobium sp. HY1793]